MIAIVRTEQARRTSLLKDKDPSIAYDQWLFTDEPFLNELCLMFLVTLRHQLDRELVGLAARADAGGNEISHHQYQEKVESLQITSKKGKKRLNWKKISKTLNLTEEDESTKALRLLSNSYKHDISMQSDKGLLELLSLETGVNYAPLPESDTLRKKLAVFIGLGEDADYCDIAEQFVDKASGLLTKVQSRIKLGRFEASLKPRDFAR